jgi:hypothetical protein
LLNGLTYKLNFNDVETKRKAAIFGEFKQKSWLLFKRFIYRNFSISVPKKRPRLKDGDSTKKRGRTRRRKI